MNNELEDNFSLKKSFSKVKKGVMKHTPTGQVVRLAGKVVNKKNLGKVVSAGEKLGKTAVKVAKKIADSSGMVLLKPLNPFKIGMKKILKAKGESDSGNLLDITQRFYNKIIRGKGKNGHFDDLEENFLEKHPLFSIHRNDYDFDNETHFESQNHIDPVTITLVVSSIVSYFKSAKNKKEEVDKGSNTTEPLTKEDAIAADTTIAVQKDLKEKEKGAEPVTKASNMKTYLIIGGVAVAIIVGYFLLRNRG